MEWGIYVSWTKPVCSSHQRSQKVGSTPNCLVAASRTVSLLIIIFFAALPWAALSSAPLVLKLKQKSPTWGHCDLWISSKAVRMDVRKIAVRLILKSPKWNVFVVSDKKRMIYTCQAKDFQSPLGLSMAIGSPSYSATIKFSGKRSAKILELKSIQYKLASDVTAKKTDHTWQKLLVTGGDYWVLAAVPVPACVAQVIQKIYGIPEDSHVPLKVITTNSRGKSQEKLDTTEARQVSEENDLFLVPVGYKQARTIQEVFFDTNSQDILYEMIR